MRRLKISLKVMNLNQPIANVFVSDPTGAANPFRYVNSTVYLIKTKLLNIYDEVYIYLNVSNTNLPNNTGFFKHFIQISAHI